jgi:predicted histidine transporter YuiF (NhaC family)
MVMVMVALLLDDHDPVAMVMMMTPAMVPVTVRMGAGVVPAVMMMTMAAALDDHGLRACDRRNGDRECANGRNDKSKLSHECPPLG